MVYTSDSVGPVLCVVFAVSDCGSLGRNKIRSTGAETISAVLRDSTTLLQL